ncbi:hypothetical protein WDW89_03400 [Deltaproteobacteria bacterium TL4]
MKQMIRLKNDRSFFISSLCVGVFFSLIVGCASFDKYTAPPSEVKKFQKKVIYTQSTDGGNGSISVIEESLGGQNTIRILLKKDGIDSTISHKIEDQNFVISVPLQDPTTVKFGPQTGKYEEDQKARVESLLARYLPLDRFSVSLRLVWDQQKLDELQLKSAPLLKAASSLEEKSININYELERAVVRQDIKILLDNALPDYQERFVNLLLPSQMFYVKERGDVITVERTVFPKASPVSIAPREEEDLTKKIEKLISEYVNLNDFVTKVKFVLIQGASSKKTSDKGVKNTSDEIRMDIEVLLNDTVAPEVDAFLKRSIPLIVSINPDRGDQLNISRKRFPEKEGVITSEKLVTLHRLQTQINTAFEAGDYVNGLALIQQALKVAVQRKDKLSLLKMKGSLHFLLQEKEQARETWKHVISLDPEDQDALQMLNSLAK